MARSPSIILSKVEKKAVVTELKLKIKAAQVETKAVNGAMKLAKKMYDAADKDSTKALAALAKGLVAHQAQLAALTAPAASV